MKTPPPATPLSRRRFLALTGLAAVIPTILPGCATGRGVRPAPSNRVVLGLIGTGWMGTDNGRAFLGQSDCQVVACCDLDQNHLRNAVEMVNQHYQNRDCRSYHDFRELVTRPDIDAVMVATPDHWHALVAIAAANAGKDIYGEKPLARTIAEQQAIVRAVQRNQRIWQTGSWQRSQRNFHKACEIVRNGLIGRISRVEVGLPAGHSDFAKTRDKMNVTPPPPELDYDFWIGPSQMMPYIEARVHKNWRWHYNTGGGQLLDWIGHHCDIAHWGLGNDEAIGPLEIEGYGEFPPADAVWNTCTKYRITLQYPGNIQMIIAGGHPDIKGGTKWIGTDGWVWVNRGGFEASDPAWSEWGQLPDNLRRVRLYESSNHYRNFLDCVKSRQRTITPVEVAHRSAIPGHLGLIAMIVGRKLRWDARREVILGDAEASKLLTRPFRAPWKLS